MNKNLVAKASVNINVSDDKVWDALVNPEAIRQYMSGAHVVTDWREGKSIIWKGEWQGKAYQDKGIVIRFKPRQTLQYSHFSPPLSGLPDKPENYHFVTIDLSEVGNETRVSLSQYNNPTEQARDHSQKNWETMLAALKKFMEP